MFWQDKQVPGDGRVRPKHVAKRRSKWKMKLYLRRQYVYVYICDKLMQQDTEVQCYQVCSVNIENISM
jgi:hypothetical protein